MDDGPLIVGSIGEVAAMVPHALGITPRDSLVVLPTRPGTTPIARVDMPSTARGRQMVAAGVARGYHGRGGEVVLLAFTDRLELAESACEQMRARLEPGTAVVAMAAVHEDQWVRLDRAEAGTIGQDTRDRLAAENAYRGHRAPYGSEGELRASFDTTTPLPAPAMQAARAAAAAAAAEQAAAGTERAWMSLAIDRFAATGRSPNEADAARLIADVQHVGLRDHAWAQMDTGNATAHAALWKDLLTRSPAGTEAATASLTAFASWLRGDGLAARVALDRVPTDPPYTMARLIDSALTGGMDPGTWQVPARMRGPDPQPNTTAARPTPGRDRHGAPRLGPGREPPCPGDEGDTDEPPTDHRLHARAAAGPAAAARWAAAARDTDRPDPPRARARAALSRRLSIRGGNSNRAGPRPGGGSWRRLRRPRRPRRLGRIARARPSGRRGHARRRARPVRGGPERRAIRTYPLGPETSTDVSG